MKKSGVELIAEERREQIEKHGRTIDLDVKLNVNGQLSFAASLLCCPNPSSYASPLNDYGCPHGWEVPTWIKMVNKPYNERLIIAGALIAAEYDRLQNK